MIRMPILAVGVLLTLHQAAPPRFRAGVEVVRVNVLATDGNRPVAGLTAADFELRDSGVVQEIASAMLADVPVSMTLVLDTSESVKGSTLTQLKNAADAAIDQLGAGDRVSLLTFHSGVRLQAEWTNTPQRVRDAIQAAAAGGGTSLSTPHLPLWRPVIRRPGIDSSSFSSATAWTPPAGCPAPPSSIGPGVRKPWCIQSSSVPPRTAGFCFAGPASSCSNDRFLPTPSPRFSLTFQTPPAARASSLSPPADCGACLRGSSESSERGTF